MKKTITIVLLAGVATWLACSRHSNKSTDSTSSTSSTRSRPVIRAAMHAVVPEIQACYEQDASLPGVLAVTAVLDISRDADLGTRVDAVVHADDGSPLSRDFAHCMRTALETLDLPAPEQVQHVTYPFTFRRAGL
ncbi:MAG TPA: hypothetical protein VGL61_25580 [Kofleriaceae bacterium]|jgi:hypothetical protein